MAVNLRHLDLAPLLRCVLTEDEVTSIDLTKSVAILQPDRVHFDRYHGNTELLLWLNIACTVG